MPAQGWHPLYFQDESAMRTRIILATLTTLAMVSVSAYAFQEAETPVTDQVEVEAVVEAAEPVEVDAVVTEETVGVEAVAVVAEDAEHVEQGDHAEHADETHTEVVVEVTEEPTL
ncbi:MAG TPA: hypothetical protein DCQ53_00130 [Alphaproteobacteria bacterium]|nr:hypothetical protein [Alphaproteobacteria bacterium]